jgi:inorganic pyrophosphatase
MAFIIKDYNDREAHDAEENKKVQADSSYQKVRMEPDYQGCVRISTEASLKKMVLPGVLVLGSPLAARFLFGPPAVAGLLAGAIVSGVQVAISASNTGGAWVMAKKETEKRRQAHKAEVRMAGGDVVAYEAEYKEFELNNDLDNARAQEISTIVLKTRDLRERHVAAVVGDTVGDPLKDTSGPAINILIKLSAITSLVFGSYIRDHHLFDTEQDIKNAIHPPAPAVTPTPAPAK